MNLRAVLLSPVLAFCLAGALTNPALAYCYQDNQGTAVVYEGTLLAVGVSSREDLYSASPLANRIIAHPLQFAAIDLGSTDFVGFGTYRGAATTGGTTNCPADYSAAWHIYADGNQNGIYWCRGGYGSVALNATDQTFKIRKGTCPGTSLTRMVLSLNGNHITCGYMDILYGQVSAGAESVRTTATQSLSVDYENLQVAFNAGWQFWTSSVGYCEDPPYVTNQISNTEYEVRQ